ncbi:histidine kinase dimerization/phospho-acceptor domain-containing protein [Fictibacillus iocasae]|uniref:histidine kinase n=1 Tax=Fictibacillus iocasae TaxID=2715437 RepID=A0ABW2NSI1_9BACL
MDTRWRNRTKIVAWVLLVTFGLSGIWSFIDAGDQYANKSFFESDEFDMQLEEYIDYISTAHLNSPNEDDLKKKIKVSAEDIEEHRTRYGSLSVQVDNLKAQYQPRIDDAKAAGNQEIVKLYEQERDEKIQDISENFKSEEYVKAKVIKEKEKKIDAYLKEREEYIRYYNPNQNGFQYYLEDIQTKEVYTNVSGADSISDLTKQDPVFSKKYNPSSGNGYLYISGGRPSYMEFPGNPDDFDKTYQGVITLPRSTSSENWILNQYEEYSKRQTVFYSTTGASVLALCLALLLAKTWGPLQLISSSQNRMVYNKLPVDFRLAGFLFSMLFLLPALIMNGQNYSMVYSFYSISQALAEFGLAVLLVWLTLIQGIWLYPELRKKETFQHALSIRLARQFYKVGSEAFYNRSVGIQIVLLLTVIFLSGFGAGIVVVFMESFVFSLYAFLFIIVTVPVLSYLFKRIGYFNTIVKHSHELASGKMEHDLPYKGKSALAKLARNLNALKHGVKTSKRAEAKSERLKTELITNVSHDLRTPLTSIITYTELLKSEGLTEKDREDYVDVIDRKSKRLKVLIDDLFEVSKMASGNMELSKQKVDIIQLLQQAMAEYNETIKESSVTFRLSTPSSPLYAYVDGQKIWRVFDNLIVNVLKYSMENTRVYISVTSEPNKVIISFKNVSKYELGGNIEELFERFKRGDTSRHTDGSGLGLAIAKSIIDLHDGSMEIDVDGDLFKVTIELESIS